MAHVNSLDVQRNSHLLNNMFNLKQSEQFEKKETRVTRAANSYVFKTDIIHQSLYGRSPFYKGAKLWYDLPENIEGLNDKVGFEKSIKNLLV